MEILLIKPMIAHTNRGAVQKAEIIACQGDALFTFFVNIANERDRAKLQKAVKTGKYPEIIAVNSSTKINILLKF